MSILPLLSNLLLNVISGSACTSGLYPFYGDMSRFVRNGWWPARGLGCWVCSRSTTGEDIKWNFGKFLVSNGSSIKRSLDFFFPSISCACVHAHARSPLPYSTFDNRYEPTTSPKAILPDIESAVNRARLMS